MERYRLWIISAVVGILAVLDGLQPIYLSDFQAFAIAGRRLLSADWASVFSFDRIQVGPLHLAFDGSIDMLSDLFVIDHQVVLSVAIQVGFVAGLILGARALAALAGRTLPPVAEVGLAAASVALTMPWTLYLTGHHAEGFIPLLWLFAAVHASRDRQERAGVLIAASALLKGWGILGLPLLLFGLKRDRWWRGASVAIGLAVLVYAPFFIFGEVNTFGYQWTTTTTGTLTSLFVDVGEPFGWGMRALQAAATVGAGLAAVWYARKHRSVHALWAVPLVMTGVRLLLDPIADWYHWMPAQTAALIGVVLLVSARRSVVNYALAAACYPLFLTWSSGPNGVWAVLVGVGALVLVTSDTIARAPEPEDQPSEQPALQQVTTTV